MTMVNVGILTVSDSCVKGTREDLSGLVIEQMLLAEDFQIVEKRIVPDDPEVIAAELKQFCDEGAVDVVLTTGGTGLGPRDVTPEATESVCEKLVTGISEIIRVRGGEKTMRAVLSRTVAGVRGKTLIVNLPGSPKGVRESLEVIVELLGHAVKMMHGGGH
jgi:molybdenum cofactor synthesis domain-containing protein